MMICKTVKFLAKEGSFHANTALYKYPHLLEEASLFVNEYESHLHLHIPIRIRNEALLFRISSCNIDLLLNDNPMEDINKSTTNLNTLGVGGVNLSGSTNNLNTFGLNITGTKRAESLEMSASLMPGKKSKNLGRSQVGLKSSAISPMSKMGMGAPRRHNVKKTNNMMKNKMFLDGAHDDDE